MVYNRLYIYKSCKKYDYILHIYFVFSFMNRGQVPSNLVWCPENLLKWLFLCYISMLTGQNPAG